MDSVAILLAVLLGAGVIAWLLLRKKDPAMYGGASSPCQAYGKFRRQEGATYIPLQKGWTAIGTTPDECACAASCGQYGSKCGGYHYDDYGTQMCRQFFGKGKPGYMPGPGTVGVKRAGA